MQCKIKNSDWKIKEIFIHTESMKILHVEKETKIHGMYTLIRYEYDTEIGIAISLSVQMN